ncbi:MAG TPA: PAS domain S-box protein [Pyrinomonadaceae bacterium]|nr:PAS domain S-box protein [Pyrinomonadaceae bacterium]
MPDEKDVHEPGGEDAAPNQQPDGSGVLRAIVEGTSDAVFAKDADGRYVFVNSACASFLGKCVGEILGRRDQDIYPPEIAARFTEDDAEVLRAGSTLVFEGVAPGVGGTQLYRVTKGVVRDADGRAVGVFGISHDLTERRRAEEERVERARAEAERREAEAAARTKDELLRELRESEERYRSLLENANDIIYSHDLEGNYLTINRACENVTGYTREEILGGLKISQVVAPEHLDLARRMMEQKLRDLSPTVYAVDIITKDGRRLTLEVSTRISYRDGQPVAVEGIARDVTERKRIEAERAHLYERAVSARHEAEEANRLKDEFLATLSHELRTPLTSILGWAHMLDGGSLDEATTRNAVRVIRRNAEHQQQLVDDILDASRIITGKLKVEIGPMRLMPVVDGAIEAVGPAAAAKGVEIACAFDPGAEVISGDAHRLQQVVWNLLSNAVKFTPAGGRVKVSVERLPAHVRIAVSDTGEGVAPDFLPHVFERFRQADGSTTRRHGGLGLGLSIVRYLVEAHGGTVHVYSAGRGQGATFAVDIPASGARAPVQAAGANGRQAGSAYGRAASVKLEETEDGDDVPPALVGLRVLLVDDDADALALLRLLLEKNGAEVFAVGSASAVLEAFAGFRPDVILSDIGMPGGDGFELLKRVRALGESRGGDVPALALTAYASEVDRERSLAAGFHQHLAKPVDPQALVAAIAAIAGRAAAARE